MTTMEPSGGGEVRASQASVCQSPLAIDQLRESPGSTAATPVDSARSPPHSTIPVRPGLSSKKGKRPNRLMKELAAFNNDPKNKVAMTQENLEIAGVWHTRYSSKVMNHKDPSRLPSPPKNLNVKRMVKDQILPKNKVKDQNAFGGAGVPVTHALDGSAEGSEDIAEIYESSEGSSVGSNAFVDDEAKGDSTYNTHRASSAGKRQRTPKKSTAKQSRKKAASREEFLASHEEETKSAQDLYIEWAKRKGTNTSCIQRQHKDEADMMNVRAHPRIACESGILSHPFIANRARDDAACILSSCCRTVGLQPQHGAGLICLLTHARNLPGILRVPGKRRKHCRSTERCGEGHCPEWLVSSRSELVAYLHPGVVHL